MKKKHRLVGKEKERIKVLKNEEIKRKGQRKGVYEECEKSRKKSDKKVKILVGKEKERIYMITMRK